jgi:hypothetical protein
MSYLIKAINNLRPSSEFSFTDNDYSTIQWHVLEGTAPTKKQVEDEIAKIKAAELAEEAAKVAAASSAIAKLEALGLTAEEIAAIR